MTTFLTQEQIKRNCPSAFTVGKAEITGNQYEQIPTYEVLQGLFDMGFGVTQAVQTNTRIEENKGFGKHMIRLRRYQDTLDNGNIPELVLINSHDGRSSYQLRAGIYRLVCSNGLVVGNDIFCQKVRHQGDVVSKVAEAGGDIIEVFPEVIDKSKEWSNIQLNEYQKRAFAESAQLLKWDGEDENEVFVDDLYRLRRYEDNKNDLWTNFNVVQENIIKGGVRLLNKETKKARRSRPVKSTSENMRLNTALWQLTEKMASLAK